MVKTEVLAPAGNTESLIAAVRSGADAVYFGAKDFNARRNAVNLSDAEIKDTVKYCKQYNVKTYLALNIAVKESELEKAFAIAKSAYLNGVDGIIVSDLGLARIINKRLPDIELHASTQMSVNSPSALKTLKELGFCRVVAAREMSKKELEELLKEAKKLDMEIEVFVHGALCMCLSGQCLLSSVLGARSGNRGLCAGPCRLAFSVENGTGYDLSLKDLSLFSYIGELTEMGVKSFKIEGRMKRPEYISACTYACRTAVDKGYLSAELEGALKNVFSRSGFTDGYYTGKLGREMFGIRTKEDVYKSKETYSFLHNIYRNERPKIPVKITAEICKDKPVKIKIESKKFSAEAEGKTPDTAKSFPVTAESIKQSLSKLGGTPFFVKNIEIKLEKGLFVSNGELNELRRSAVQNLSLSISKVGIRRILSYEIEKKDKERKERKIFAKFLDISQIPKNLSGVDLLIVPLEKAEEKLPEFKNIAVEIPKFTSDENAISKLLQKAKNKGIKTALCDTLSAVNLAKENGFNVIGGTGLNVFNGESANVLKDGKVEYITLSPEMSLLSATRLKTDANKGVFAYGRLPLMTTRNCPIKNGKNCDECDKKGYITDRTKTDFPIRCRLFCAEILNSKPVYLADRLAEITNTDFLLLSFTTETESEAEKIISEYISGGKPPKDFTRGLYFRDVL
ncbi:MAG: U32 family peptidase [Clostridia bacterium]|nr:U32 family peptidase [Clostridia bacterium]